MISCPDCQASVNDDHDTCPSCGAQLQIGDEQRAIARVAQQERDRSARYEAREAVAKADDERARRKDKTAWGRVRHIAGDASDVLDELL